MLVHTLFLALTLLVALTPLTLAAGRSAAFGAVWLTWVGLNGGLALLTALEVFTFSPPILRLAAHLGGQLAVGVLLFLALPAIRNAIRSIPLIWLVRWQTARVMGGFFLIGAAMGEVSMPFAAIAGIGDIFIGIAAWATARRMTAQNENRLAARHTAMGLTDFTVAIGTAIITQANLGWPYIMIPLFLVPLAILAHLAVLDRIFGAKPAMAMP